MIVMTDIALDTEAGWAHRTHFESRPQAALADSVHRLHRHLRENFPFEARITIADNASVDDTPRIAAELAEELTDVRAVRCTRCGPPRTHRCWPTWTSTCPRTSRRSPRWSPRLSPATRTWRSAPGWAGARGSCAGRSVRSSRAATT